MGSVQLPETGMASENHARGDVRVNGHVSMQMMQGERPRSRQNMQTPVIAADVIDQAQTNGCIPK
jgi:hypothetical protein